MNTYGIDERVWKKVVGRGWVWPGSIALAASVCPELLNEGIKWQAYASLHDTETSKIAIECGTSPLQIRNALADWATNEANVMKTLERLAEWDRRLAVWCACAVAETVLKYVPVDEGRPRTAITTVRAWVLGHATTVQVQIAGRGANAAAKSATAVRASVNYAAEAAAFATAYAADAAVTGPESYQITAAANVAHEAATAEASVGRSSPAYELDYPEWPRVRDANLKPLREVVAGAIISYPTTEETNASRGLASGRTLVAGALGVMLGAGIVRAVGRR